MKKFFMLIATASLTFTAIAIGGATNAATPTTSAVNFGGDPTGIAITSDGSNAYIADCANNLLKEVSLSTNLVSNIATVGTCPMSVVLSPDGKTAYVPNYWSQDLSVVDLTSKTVTATVPLTGSLFSISITQDGSKLLVPNSIGDVFIIDTATNTILQTVAVDGAPVYSAFSPDGLTAYVTSANTPTLSVIDVATGTVSHTYTFNVGQLYGVTLNFDGSKAFVAEFDGGSGTSVLQIDTASGVLDKTMTVCAGPQNSSFAPDSSLLLVACVSGNLNVLNVETGVVASTVSTESGSRYVAITPDGSNAVVGNLDSHSLTVVSFDPALVPPVEPGKVVDKNAGGLAATGVESNPALLLVGLVLMAVAAVFGLKSKLR